MKQSLGPRPAAYPLPVFVVGTYDHAGRANAMVAAWGGICASEPPAIAISVRPFRYTYRNLMEKRAFTVSIPPVRFMAEADFFGIAPGEETDKFAATGLTPVRSTLVDAPFVREFPIVLECRVINRLEIGSHVQFVGQILDVKADEAVLDGEGRPDPEKVDALGFDFMRSEYHAMGKPVGKAFSSGNRFRK
jgi:flavin reductase (DIM6/NTAB) family NADH-FMN oxidoreductase RutF